MYISILFGREPWLWANRSTLGHFHFDAFTILKTGSGHVSQHCGHLHFDIFTTWHLHVQQRTLYTSRLQLDNGHFICTRGTWALP